MYQDIQLSMNSEVRGNFLIRESIIPKNFEVVKLFFTYQLLAVDVSCCMLLRPALGGHGLGVYDAGAYTISMQISICTFVITRSAWMYVLPLFNILNKGSWGKIYYK